ncbi:unnamed protein product [Ectocarpus sp. CCAP 1310/34]|nr:unnamed protein product [Ectocarpus sp. CCAP 1310/34]
MDNDHVQPSKKRSFNAISQENPPTPDTPEADRERGGWQCSPSPHAAETSFTDADAADRVGQYRTIPPVPRKEDASTGGRKTGRCVESMIGAVDANRTEDVDLSIGPPQSQDSHGAGSSELPLSPEDIHSFEENGFVMLKRAFDPDVAAACRQGRKMTKTMESLWKRLKGDGIRREEPATWIRKKGISEIYGIAR